MIYSNLGGKKDNPRAVDNGKGRDYRDPTTNNGPEGHDPNRRDSGPTRDPREFPEAEGARAYRDKFQPDQHHDADHFAGAEERFSPTLDYMKKSQGADPTEPRTYEEAMKRGRKG